MLRATRIAIRARFAPTTDEHNHRVDAWGEPEPVFVFCWAPVEESADIEQGRTPVMSVRDIAAPPGVTGSHDDKWWLDGVEYRQVGGVKDCTTGPFGFTPGVVVRVRRIEG